MNIDDILRESERLTGNNGKFATIEVDTDAVEVSLANSLIDARDATSDVALNAGSFEALEAEFRSGLTEELRRQKLLAAATIKTEKTITEIMGRGLEAEMKRLQSIAAEYGRK